MPWTVQTQTGLGTLVRSLDSIPTGPCTLYIPGLWERWYKSHLKPVREDRCLEVWLQTADLSSASPAWPSSTSWFCRTHPSGAGEWAPCRSCRREGKRKVAM